MDGLSMYGNTGLANSVQYAYGILNMQMKNTVTVDKRNLSMMPNIENKPIKSSMMPKLNNKSKISKGKIFDTYA